MKILPILITLLLLGGSFIVVNNISQSNDLRSRAFDTEAQKKVIDDPTKPGQPATISNVQLTKEDKMIVVSWTTSLPSTSYIEYGLNKDKFDNMVNASGDNTFKHTVAFLPLDNVRHCLRIRAKGINGKEAISSVYNYKP